MPETRVIGKAKNYCERYVRKPLENFMIYATILSPAIFAASTQSHFWEMGLLQVVFGVFSYLDARNSIENFKLSKSLLNRLFKKNRILDKPQEIFENKRFHTKERIISVNPSKGVLNDYKIDSFDESFLKHYGISHDQNLKYIANNFSGKEVVIKRYILKETSVKDSLRPQYSTYVSGVGNRVRHYGQSTYFELDSKIGSELFVGKLSKDPKKVLKDLNEGKIILAETDSYSLTTDIENQINLDSQSYAEIYFYTVEEIDPIVTKSVLGDERYFNRKFKSFSYSEIPSLIGTYVKIDYFNHAKKSKTAKGRVLSFSDHILELSFNGGQNIQRINLIHTDINLEVLNADADLLRKINQEMNALDNEGILTLEEMKEEGLQLSNEDPTKNYEKEQIIIEQLYSRQDDI